MSRFIKEFQTVVIEVLDRREDEMILTYLEMIDILRRLMFITISREDDIKHFKHSFP